MNEFVLPAIFARVGPRLPQWPHALGMCAALNAAQVLKLLSRDALAAFEGKTFGISVTDAGIDIRFKHANGRFAPVFGQGEADVRFAATLVTFVRMARREEDPDTLFFNRKLAITGDTALGLQIKNLLDAVEWPAWMVKQI
jgi:O2-independent ubiquinone biosynthesis accessory factor UbiT